MFLCGAYGFLRPQGAMNFTNVSFSKVKHTDTGLTDSASDGKWEFFLENGFLEVEFSPVFASADF